MAETFLEAEGGSIAKRRDYLRLALVYGVGPRLMASLLDYFESPTEVLAASRTQLNEVARVGPKLADAICNARYDDLVDRVLEHSENHGVRILIPEDDEFPSLLNEIAAPPLMLFIRGELAPEDQLSIGIVGTRHPTHYGRVVAEGLARSLSRAGLTIVSGLARGIDAYAHRATIETGGRTIAFLGSSVTDVYPAEHSELADEIAAHGAVISETDPFSKPKAGVFPQRNRLISGISLGVIVVEAAQRSGALITATHAGEQGRDIFAVPGPVNSRMSQGCNHLIRDGAILIQNAQDVLDHLGPLFESVHIAPDKVVRNPVELKLNEQEQLVLQAIESIPSDIDEVIVRCGLSVSRVLSTVSALEMRGLIRRVGGRSVQRV
jgi:DNA processing protein